MAEYGIKYFKAQLDSTTYILIPICLVEGYSVGEKYFSDKIYPIALQPTDYTDGRVVVDSIMTEADLQRSYEMSDIDFLKDYYFTEEKERVIIVETKDGKISKRKFNLNIVKSENPLETYEFFRDKPAVTLNEDAIFQLLSIDDITELKKELQYYQKQMSSLEKVYKKEGVTKITLQDGKIQEIETERPVIEESQAERPKLLPSTNPLHTQDISVEGLEKYIKERVFGHDDEIKDIATILVMNYYSTYEFGTESLLIPGPTGTGKTATFIAASEYLNIPSVFVNTINLVPQGIKGTSLEDKLVSLLTITNGDQLKAEKGIMIFDEFDKIGEVGTELKEDLKQIMLKFIEGGDFQIERQRQLYQFNTRMLSKAFLGSFQEVFKESKKSIGFGADQTETSKTFDLQKMYESTQFSRELITRIAHIIPYYELTNDIKKRVILESKISEYLLKKKRYQAQFGIELVDSMEYVDALIENLSLKDKSMRDLNNMISKSLLQAENAILRSNGRAKKLILNGDTVTNPSSFILQ